MNIQIKDFETYWGDEPEGLSPSEQLLLLQAVRPDAVTAFLRDAANECVRDTFAIVEAPSIDPSEVGGALDAIAECSEDDIEEEENLPPIPDMVAPLENFDDGLADAVATSRPAAPIIVVAPNGDLLDWKAKVAAEVRILARNLPSRTKVSVLDLNDEYKSIEVGC